jgi:hypothetical protein
MSDCARRRKGLEATHYESLGLKLPITTATRSLLFIRLPLFEPSSKSSLPRVSNSGVVGLTFPAREPRELDSAFGSINESSFFLLLSALAFSASRTR